MRDQDRVSGSLNEKNQSSYLHVRDHQGLRDGDRHLPGCLDCAASCEWEPPPLPLPGQGQSLFQRPVCLQAGHGSGGSFWLSWLCQQELSLRSGGVNIIGVSIFSKSLHKLSLKEGWIFFFFLHHSNSVCFLTLFPPRNYNSNRAPDLGQHLHSRQNVWVGPCQAGHSALGYCPSSLFFLRSTTSR